MRLSSKPSSRLSPVINESKPKDIDVKGLKSKSSSTTTLYIDYKKDSRQPSDQSLKQPKSRVSFEF